MYIYVYRYDIIYINLHANAYAFGYVIVAAAVAKVPFSQQQIFPLALYHGFQKQNGLGRTGEEQTLYVYICLCI